MNVNETPASVPQAVQRALPPHGTSVPTPPQHGKVSLHSITAGIHAAAPAPVSTANLGGGTAGSSAAAGKRPPPSYTPAERAAINIKRNAANAFCDRALRELSRGCPACWARGFSNWQHPQSSCRELIGTMSDTAWTSWRSGAFEFPNGYCFGCLLPQVGYNFLLCKIRCSST